MAFNSNETSRWGGRPDEFYEFTVLGGPTFRYTPMRLPLTYQGHEYAPKVIQRGNFTYKKDFSGDDSMNLQVQADLDILKLFKIIVPRRTMTITIYRRHRGDGDLDVYPMFFGRVRGVTWEGVKATIECDSKYAMTKRGGLNLNFQVTCNNFLFDSNCGLQKGDWDVSGPLQKITNGVQVQCPAFATKPDGWFKYGALEAGEGSYFIIGHAGDTVTLLNGLEGVPPGTTITATAGCDRRLDTCWDKFLNGLNYNGFNWSPADNIFTDGI